MTGLSTPLVGGKPQGFRAEVFEYESSAAFNSGAAGRRLARSTKCQTVRRISRPRKAVPVAEERFKLRKPNGKETGSHSIDELSVQVQTDSALPAGSQCGVYIGLGPNRVHHQGSWRHCDRAAWSITGGLNRGGVSRGASSRFQFGRESACVLLRWRHSHDHTIILRRSNSRLRGCHLQRRKLDCERHNRWHWQRNAHHPIGGNVHRQSDAIRVRSRVSITGAYVWRDGRDSILDANGAFRDGQLPDHEHPLYRRRITLDL